VTSVTQARDVRHRDTRPCHDISIHVREIHSVGKQK
jgi:hypothetical protein